MTYNQLFSLFRNKFGDTHDVIFFELLFSCSPINNKEDFITYSNNEIPFKQQKFWKLTNQYFKKEKPLAHITGHIKFCGLDFAIDKKVLAPRDVTEEMTNDFITSHKNVSSASIWDLCCGSGCIGISIKKYLPQLQLTCIDKYWNPIFNTHKNARKHKIALTIDRKDVFSFLEKTECANYIISNPPYINANNFTNKKMFKYESKKSLIAPDNGMYFYKKYFEWLNKHNFIEAWFEIGYDLIDAIKSEINKYEKLVLTLPKNKQYIIIKRKQ